MKSEAKMQCALNIAKNALDSKKVIFSQRVQKLTDRVYSISDIGTRDSQVLKSTNKRSIKSRIRNQRTIRRQVLRNNDGV